MKLVSACLVGIPCRYDGKSALNKKLLKLFKEGKLIPVCPEQLGGLPTPREPAEILNDRVITKRGKDVTKNFLAGAKTVLRIAKLLKIKQVFLRGRSPSCGSGWIYDGTFSGKLKKGDGITAALLKKNRIRVISY